MSQTPKRIVYLTAGAGGMYCGSCLNDNMLARAMTRLGVDIQLVPTYTPITTDEIDVSRNEVYFGGINVFLQQKFPWLRWLPPAFDWLLNNPALIRWATQKDVQADPHLLGAMTVSMLRGSHGFQRKEVHRLLDFLDRNNPDVINFTNALIAGSIPEIKKRLPHVTTVVTLQGDDIFLDYIPEKYRVQAIDQLRLLSKDIDGFLVHSRYYAEYMSERLSIPPEKIYHVKLGIDHRDYRPRPSAINSGLKRVGYLARLTPEKGFHHVVDAFIRLRQQRDDVHLAIAGWVGSEHKRFAEEQFQKLDREGLSEAYEYAGVVDRAGKVEFLHRLDIFTVPTTYLEPKGRFALEAMASGVPVVLPSHGAFPEMIHDSKGGVLVRPNDIDHLVQTLSELLDDPVRCRELGDAGRRAVVLERNAEVMAEQTLALYAQLRDPTPAGA